MSKKNKVIREILTLYLNEKNINVIKIDNLLNKLKDKDKYKVKNKWLKLIKN